MSAPIQDLLERLVAQTRARHPERPPLIGLAGSQGSGKSFQARVFARAHPHVAHFSLDDVYHTREFREQHAELVSSQLWTLGDGGRYTSEKRDKPALKQLLITRGPPGTHDLGLAKGLIARLWRDEPTALPRFDKARDDRAPETEWPVFQGPAKAVLIDGWCLGAKPTPASDPINDLEREDADGEWRNTVAAALASDYQSFFAAFDEIVYLQAPNFEIVRRWRGEQEEEMLGRALTPAENARLDRFVQHYERITRAMLDGAHSARWIVRLDETRSVRAIEERR